MEVKQDRPDGHDERIRFQKPKWFLGSAEEDPYGCIGEVFTWIHLDDFRDELHEWLRIALINDQSAYDEGPAREDVMDFCDELQLLMEALHLINTNRQDDLREWKEGLPDDLKAEIESYNRLVLLSEKQKLNPMTVIRDFCSMFTRTYARRELWDLLDSVTYYGRDTDAWSPDPHITYQCLLSLVEAAYVVDQPSS